MMPDRAGFEAAGDPQGRRRFLKLAAGVALAGGCTGPAIRSQSPEEANHGSNTRLVGNLAVVHGMHPVRIESVGLVTGLPGTGSDPAPSPQRSALIDEMQKRGVAYPNQVLASPTTELVVVRGYLRPGIQKGDRFDIELRVPSRSEATSLRGGWLMETRLKEMAVLSGRVREGKTLALAQGPILVDPAAEGEKDRLKLTRGRVLGGGVSVESRTMGLVLKPDYQNVMNSAQVGAAVNRRFHTFTGGIKHGVADPKDDKFIEIAVHPRYKDNVERYMQVLKALPLRESPSHQLERIGLLERQLLDPITSAAAAMRLEAIGKEGIKPLLKGLGSQEAEVRFYAAEGLAYLDQSEAITPLANLARDEAAFRPYALAALSAMDDFGASEALRSLLEAKSAETRYGAFRALWAMNSHDPLVQGEDMKGQFSYHLLATQAEPMIHVTRSYRPEIVLFGHDQRFQTPLVLEAGTRIMVNAQQGETITVSRFEANQPDQKRAVSTKVDDVIRAIVELGGTYPDVVQALQQARNSKALPSRFVIDAVPQSGRSYVRGASQDDSEQEEAEAVVANPLPGLFNVLGPKGEEEGQTRGRKKAGTGESAAPARSLFGKMTSRFK